MTIDRLCHESHWEAAQRPQTHLVKTRVHYNIAPFLRKLSTNVTQCFICLLWRAWKIFSQLLDCPVY